MFTYNKNYIHVRITLVLMLIASAFYVTPAHASPGVRYVKWNAAGANNGTSWTNAYVNLQSALSAASSGDEIWVAKGTYKPTTGTDRTISFGLKNGVAIYGGFAGTETLRTQRNLAANLTVLSGEIGVAGTTDNSYNVVVGGVINNTAVLDGFTVAAGNANGANPFDAGGGMNLNSSNPSLANVIFSNNLASFGGGMYNDSSNPTLLNVTFIDNLAEDGGGMYNFNSSPSLINATFIGNTATVSSGGGLFNFANSSPTLTNVEFSGNSSKAVGGGIANQNDSNPSLTNVSLYNNSAGDFGGGMANSGSSPTLINVTFSANKAAAGGGIGSFSSSPTVTTVLNSILWGDTGGEIADVNSSSSVVNFSIVQGDYSGTGNLNSDPLLGALANNGGFTQTMGLGSGSPAIDTGNDATCPATDQRGVTRPFGSHCDIGAFEYVAGLDTVGVFRPGNGALYLRNSNTTGFADVAINYGLAGDYPVVGDWDGDGDDTIGVYRNGVFYLRNSNSVGFANITVAFGSPGDQPIVGDWNNDGFDTIGVFQSSTGTFLLRNTNTPGTPDLSFVLGNPGDVGIAGDWNGDGMDTTGVFRPSNGMIFLKNTNATGFANIALNYGVPGDQPVVGDWDNNGTTTIGIYRNARFYLRNSNTNGFADIQLDLGNIGDMPIAGNWDGKP